MKDRPVFPLQIFYDGSCSVCAFEAERYGRMDGEEGRLILVDVSVPSFDPLPYKISLSDFMNQLHVIDRNGNVFRGVEAFWAIWQAFPSSTLLGLCGKLITLPLINTLAKLSYRLFADIRGYLPKRKNGCSRGSCRIGTG